jgi:DNA-3-methyladenine glycosylase I
MADEAGNDGKIRCVWCGDDPLYRQYHDEEWGLPLRDDARLFELLTLEGAQAGLSWITILRKREHYRRVFDGFDAAKVAVYDQAKIDSLLQDPGIVRNRLKVESTVSNARAFLDLKQAGESFSEYLWSFVGGEPIVSAVWSHSEIKAETAESKAMSKSLKKRGFRFVGPTICYAFMQAAGLVNDHVLDCFRYTEV